MRGQPIELPPITQGLQTNVPPHLVQPGALLDGSNVFTDVDGLTKPRFGYTPFLTPGPNIGAVNGLFWWIDLDGSNQYIAVSPTDAATVAAGAWHTITGFPTLQGAYTDPVMFATYFQNNAINILFTNNHDPLKLWNVKQSTLQNLTPTVALSGLNTYSGTVAGTLSAYPVGTQFFFAVASTNTSTTVTFNLNGLGPKLVKKLAGGAIVNLAASDLIVGTSYNFSYDGTEFLLGTNLLAPIARDLTVIGDRVVAANILNGGIRNFTQMAWSAAFDMTLWPALAFYNLSDLGDNVVAVKPIGNSAGIVYGSASGSLMQTVGGVQDPFAFQFSPIRGMTTGPVSPSAVIIAEGLHYYLGSD